MAVWQIVLLTLVIYHAIGFIITLIIDLLTSYNEEAFGFYWGIWIITFPIFGIIKTVDGMRRLKHYFYGFSIVQKNADEGREYVRELCKYKDLGHFENSDSWHIVKRYPKYRETRAGYEFDDNEGGKTILGYNIEYVTDDELDAVKNEENCYHCAHDGVDCNDDECLCSCHVFSDPPEYPEFKRDPKKTK